MDLRDALAETITEVTQLGSLTPGHTPSSTVAVFRWTNHDAEALVLGDSAIIAQTTTGILPVRDDRLGEVATEQRHAYRDHLKKGGGYGKQHQRLIRDLVKNERSERNRPGGYWIAEAVPGAAHHALTSQWLLRDLTAVVLATDGVSRGIDQLGMPASWVEAISIADTQNPGALLDIIHQVETTDPDGQRWPRSKAHDDKTAVLVTFKPHPLPTKRENDRDTFITRRDRAGGADTGPY